MAERQRSVILRNNFLSELNITYCFTRLSWPTWATKTPMTAVANSGADDPAAMNVAPATSGGMFKTEKRAFIATLTSVIAFDSLTSPI